MAYCNCSYGACADCDSEIAAERRGNVVCWECDGETPARGVYILNPSAQWYRHRYLCVDCKEHSTHLAEKTLVLEAT